MSHAPTAGESPLLFPDTLVNIQGDLWIIVGACSLSESPWPSYSCFPLQAVEFLAVVAGASHGGPSISFGAPEEDQMLIAASEGGLETYGEEDSAAGEQHCLSLTRS